jgi:hypothetical protein
MVKGRTNVDLAPCNLEGAAVAAELLALRELLGEILALYFDEDAEREDFDRLMHRVLRACADAIDEDQE